MLPAGIVADSRPRNAQSVSAATAGTLVDSARSPVSATVKCEASKAIIPATPTSASGSSFRSVVTTWTHPAARTPTTLTPTSTHTAAIAAAAARTRAFAS